MNIEKVSLCNVSLVYDSLVSHFVFIFTFLVVSRFYLLPDLTLFFDFPDRRAAFCNKRTVVPIYSHAFMSNTGVTAPHILNLDIIWMAVCGHLHSASALPQGEIPPLVSVAW